MIRDAKQRFPEGETVQMTGPTMRSVLLAFCASWVAPSLVMSGALAASTSCGPVDLRLTMTPIPPTKVNVLQWVAKYDLFAASKAGRLVFGDSLARGLGAPDGTANLGLPGARIQEVLWLALDPRLAMAVPKEVVIIVGTNNLAAGDPGCAVGEGISLLAYYARTFWPGADIFLFKIPPRYVASSEREEARRIANDKIASLPRMTKVHIIDAEGRLACPDYKACALYQADGVHFTTNGYAVLEDELNRARLHASSHR
jgi:hypothetical protein